MTHLFIYFIYLLIYLSLFKVQPRFNEGQGNGERAVLYGLVKLSFDLAYSSPKIKCLDVYVNSLK